MFFPENSPNYSTPERLVAAMGQLPPMAQVLSRLQRLLSDTNSGLDDIAALIRLDPAMTTRVIQISNSAWFGRGGGCRTIEMAVNRVGFREVYHVVAVAASGAIVAQPLAAYGRDALTMWRESVAGAFAAETLAERLGEDTAVAYMSGLLHGIGRLAINKCLIGADGHPVKMLADEGFPRDHSGAENALLGFTQADVGACMLEKWAFAAENVESVRHQYEPLEAEEPHDRMSAVVYCARYLRSAVNQPEVEIEAPGLDDVLAALRLDREELLGFLPVLENQVSRAMQIMKV
ncbi:HDOD domain-containing protein [Opitutus terrae]|uniref:HDOD domain-containing protein n=1 Tax=Opitutus terrae TaxID=107709 RepID=UPI0013051252|nr:HDOD domain-containing protein [Opitutus terrae]